MEPENSHGDDQPFLGGEGDASGGERHYEEDENSDGDCEDDVDVLGATEHVIRSRQKLNSVASISSLRIKPLEISRHHIPLCRMVAMPMVRPCLASDLTKLEQEFVHGYRDGSAVFYVSITNEQGELREVTEEDLASWGPLWRQRNEQFNRYLQEMPALRQFTNSMFFVCDGNHRRVAWMNHINRLHNDDITWHYLVDSIILDTKGRIGAVMQVMHDINK